MIPLVDALDSAVPLQGLLGYLNFSEGRPDARIQKTWNDAYAFLVQQKTHRPWLTLAQCLQGRLGTLHQGQAAAFRNIEQASSVLDLVFGHVVPAYQAHHADLLAHLPEDDFHQPFFLARVAEAVLSQRAPWTETNRIVEGSLRELNDFLGHRPFAVLEGRRRGEPYDHEKVRPIPLFLKGAGVAWDRFRLLVNQALDILARTERGLLAEAYFDLDMLDELARDPRAYDFGHPVDKRTNYCFGEWDPHHIDNAGFYRRFVVRQITLEGLWWRVDNGGLPRDEAIFEAAAVLAGTILMASAVSGSGPGTHDSSVTLSTLVPRIARIRDSFYLQLARAQTGARAQRLADDAKLTRQPFGAARQQLNQYLARQRALQVQQRRLALFLAELGYPHAARRQVAEIAVASARLLTEMHVRLATGNLLIDRGRADDAGKLLSEIEDFLHRGIRCGALVDPWNILGFQGQFPRFTALEDSVQDTRIDELVRVVDRLLHLHGRVIGEVAAQGDAARARELGRPMRRLAEWWDRFATTTVGDIHPVQGGEAVASAEHIAQALARWREKGASADLAFWKQHLEGFRSPKSFALVIEALLIKEDYRAAQALLMTWLGQAEQVPLAEGEHSFHALALRWMMGLCAGSGAVDEQPLAASTLELLGRFFDHLEANAEDYWQVPRINPLGLEDESTAEALPPADDEDSLYGAAYEGVTYKDSTDDDVEGEVLDVMPQKDFDLAHEEPRMERRLQFLSTVARLWNIATRMLRRAGAADRPRAEELTRQWFAKARDNYRQLQELLDTLYEHEVPKPSGSFDSMVEYEKRRAIKESLLQLSIVTCLDQALALGALRGLLDDKTSAPREEGNGSWETSVLAMERALLHKDPEQVRVLLDRFLDEFRDEPLLYTPLQQGGQPRLVLRASLAQTILRGLEANFPRQGLFAETIAVLEAAREMEKKQQLTGPRVSEFDRLFQLGLQALVEAVTDSANLPGQPLVGPALITEAVENLLEPFLKLWSDHSKNLRLSMLEAITSDQEWQRLGEFVRRYGKDLFTPRFMTDTNLRGILHRGVGAYLDYLRENQEQNIVLLDELENPYPRADAVRFLHVILQIVVDNYPHYQDYKAIATQSDYGDNLYQLLDFLRIKAAYERQAWELRPFNLVHEVLARRHPAAAELWRKQIEENTGDWADEHLNDLTDLEHRYGLYLTTIRDRLEERFVQPLAIDGLVAQVAPALEEARRLEPAADPKVPLEDALQPFALNTTGVGFTIPPWLARLEGELHRLNVQRTALVNLAETLFQVPKVIPPFDQLPGIA